MSDIICCENFLKLRIILLYIPEEFEVFNLILYSLSILTLFTKVFQKNLRFLWSNESFELFALKTYPTNYLYQLRIA